MIEERRSLLRMAFGVSASPALLANSGTRGGERAGTRRSIPSTASKIETIETFTSGTPSQPECMRPSTRNSCLERP